MTPDQQVTSPGLLLPHPHVACYHSLVTCSAQHGALRDGPLLRAACAAILHRMAPPLDPVAFAAAQRDLFRGRNLRVGGGRAVHAVDWSPWTAGESLPVPACRTGWAGHGTAGDLRPTTHPVTCRRCLALDPDRRPQARGDQPGLW